MPLTIRTRHGVLTFSNKDHGLGRRLFVDREIEYDLIERATRVAHSAGILTPAAGGDVLDIGANIGTVCITLVRANVVSGAVAFEPEPENYRFLTQNVRRNGLASRIRTMQCAVWEKDGNMELELSGTNLADHRLRTNPSPLAEERYHERQRQVIPVPAHSLDGLARAGVLDPARVRLVWMDVQGHELGVLRGGHALIRRSLPIVAEFWPYGLARAGVEPDEFCLTMRGMFDRFYDLRGASSDERPITDLPRLFEHHRGPKGSTDLLLIRDRA